MDIDKEVNIGLPKINWLASYPKSGNTWVRCLIYAYTYGFLDINSMGVLINSDLNPGAWFAAAPLPWGELNEHEKLMCRYTALMIMITTSVNRNKLILKTHCGNYRIDSVDLIPERLTNTAVYVVRDPRDVAISYAKHVGISIDETIEKMTISNLCLDFNNTGIVQPAGSWKNNVLSWYSDTKFKKVIVRYEDLITDTEKEFKRILELYFPDIDNERVKNAVELCTFDKLKKQEEDVGFLESTENTKFFTVGKSNWEEILTKDQISKIEEEQHEGMEKAGYKLYS